MPHIFISYRRADSAPYAGRIYDHLKDHFGRENIFMDIDSIPPGEDFVARIDSEVGHCDALVAVIGSKWLTVTDARGKRRLDDPNDFTRLEVATALDREIRVIPVLVDGAQMPRTEELPKALATLARRNALTISNERFEHDMGKLISTLDEVAKPSPILRPVSRPPAAKSQPKPAPTPIVENVAEKQPSKAAPALAPTATNLDGYFLVHPENASYIRGAAPYIWTSARSDLLIFVVIGIVLGGIFIYLLTQNRADLSSLVPAGLVLVGIPLAGLYLTSRELRADRTLSREGKLCEGSITSSTEKPTQEGGNTVYVRELKFRFRVPSGEYKIAEASDKHSKPVSANAPAAGTPVKVLYLDDKHYALL